MNIPIVFLGRGAIVPNVDGIQHLLQCSSTATEPQINFEDLVADDILLGMYVW